MRKQYWGDVVQISICSVYKKKSLGFNDKSTSFASDFW